MSGLKMSTAIAWQPPREYLEESNIARFMQKHRITTYQELLRRSAQDIEWFWEAIAEDLHIEWFTPYTKILDTSEGNPWAKWFINGRINIAHNCLDKHVNSNRGEKTAVIWEGEEGKKRQLTYQELHRETNRLANALKQLGIKKGDTVGILLPISPEAVVATLACCKIGAIFIPLFSGFGPTAIASRLQDCEAKLLITADGFYRRGSIVEMKKTADDAVSTCPTVQSLIVFKRIGHNIPWNPSRDHWWHEIVALQPDTYSTEQMDSEDPFMIIYTSGTTGRPKGSVHVHGGFLVKVTEEVAYQTDLRAEDILYWVTDLGWIMGPWEIIGGLALGGTIFLYDGALDYPEPDRVWDMVERHGITILGISPTAIRAFMRQDVEWVLKHNLSKLRLLGSTGEPWNPEPWWWFFKNVGGSRCPIINLSGGTEVGACFLSPLPISPLKPCTLAGPALGMDIDVFDEDGKPLRTGVGELVAKKPWPAMTRGLWKDPQRYLETYWSRWPNIWVHGDFASRDEDGFWFLHGRSDDTIKMAGKRVGPAEIESAIVSHPAASEAAAIGVPDELKGEVIVCFVVLKPNHPPSDSLRRELKTKVTEALGKTMTPEEIKFVRELPKTRNAKIMRRLIRARYLGKETGDLTMLENPQALEEVVHAT